MTDREKVLRLQELVGSLLLEMRANPDCGVCIAVRILRIKSMVDDLYGDYEGYLE